MAEPLIVTLYQRPGCGLCEVVADQLADLARELPFTVRAVDIMADAELYLAMHTTIPVVDVGGLRLQAPIHPVRLEALVVRALRGHSTHQA